MRSALLCTIPMLVLAAACADTDPVAPRHDARGVAASLGDAPAASARASTCDANATAASLHAGALGASASSMAGGVRTLTTVRVWAAAPALFVLPMNGWRVPHYNCPVPGSLPGVGDITITHTPDTASIVDPPRPPGIDDALWASVPLRLRAWIWEKAVEYADRCGCGKTRDEVFSAMVSTILLVRKEAWERPLIPVVGRTFDDDQTTVLRGHVVACEVTKVFRRFWALDDASDRAWLLRGVTADVAEREIPLHIAVGYGTNWQLGVTSGFRVGNTGSCTREYGTNLYYRTLATDPATILHSPAPAPPYVPPRLPDLSPPWNDQ
jgi:hypothetical protein